MYVLSVRIYSTVYLYWIENRVAGRIHNWGPQTNSLSMLDRQEIDTKIIQTKPFTLLSSTFF
jgi:hypothetical protein